MIRITVMSTLAAALMGTTMTVAHASEEHLATIERECGTQLKMSASACSCLRDRASKLNEKQQTFVALAVSQDPAAREMARNELTINEMTGAGQFMATAPLDCRGR